MVPASVGVALISVALSACDGSDGGRSTEQASVPPRSGDGQFGVTYENASVRINLIMDDDRVQVTGSCDGAQLRREGLDSYRVVAPNDGVVGKVICDLSFNGTDHRVLFDPDLKRLKEVRTEACMSIAQDAKCSTLESWYTFDGAEAVDISDWVVFHEQAYLSVFGSAPADDFAASGTAACCGVDS